MISVILVNYQTADLLLGAVASIFTQQGTDQLEVFVVDNSQSDSEKVLLEAQLPHEVTYIQNHENVGFAKACNQAFACASGEYILLLNPDARLLPFALSQLVKSIKERPDAGAIGPRVYWDDSCQFLLPPSTFPSPISFYEHTITRMHPRLAQYQTLSFRKKALHIWTTKNPIQVEALSGGHILLRREAILKCGGLFDESFFMYWEDTDLMRRLQKNGYRLYIEPSAGCLHYYEHTPIKDKLIGQGWSKYHLKHLQKNLSFQFTGWLNKHLPPAQTPKLSPVTLENNRLVFPVPSQLSQGWLLELSTSPHFIPSIGHFGSGPIAEVETILHSRLQNNIYFARLAAPVPKPNLIYHWQWQGHIN